jgi:hypothetical protein
MYIPHPLSPIKWSAAFFNCSNVAIPKTMIKTIKKKRKKRKETKKHDDTFSDPLQ